MFFSKNTGGFYIEMIHGNSIPDDAVEISKEKHSELMEGQSKGKIITADNNGNPILIDG